MTYGCYDQINKNLLTGSVADPDLGSGAKNNPDAGSESRSRMNTPDLVFENFNISFLG
jgi:hypothetical protein